MFFKLDWLHCFRKGKPQVTGGHKATGPLDRELRSAHHAADAMSLERTAGLPKKQSWLKSSCSPVRKQRCFLGHTACYLPGSRLFFVADFATEEAPVASSTKTYTIRREKMDWRETEKNLEMSSLRVKKSAACDACAFICPDNLIDGYGWKTAN